MDNNGRLMETLAATQPEIDENDFIYTNIVHFAWTVEQTYYPKTQNDLLGYPELWGVSELPLLDEGKEYWLFLEGPISRELCDNLETQGKTFTEVVEKGYIGTGEVWIYKILDSTD